LQALDATYLFRFEEQGSRSRIRKAASHTGVFHSQEGFFLRTSRDGVWIAVNLTITRLHVQPRTLGLIAARDVREQREAHSQLKKIEAEMRRVLSSVSDCLWSAEIDAAGRWTYRYISPVVARIACRQPAHFLPGPERWLDAVHPEDRARIDKVYRRLKD